MPALRRDLLLGWNVVIVDDELDSLEVANRILRHYGANTFTAQNGAEALQLIQQVKPRFVISDLSMPVMDGWEMLSNLQKNRATADLPVIALTAHAMPGDRQQAISAGFHNYLAKPLTPATFMQDLLQLLVQIPAFADEISEM